MDTSVYIMFIVTKLTYYGLAIDKNKSVDQSIISYLSYCLFFPALIVGPAFSYEIFLNFINLEGVFHNIKLSLKNILRPLSIGMILAVITAMVMPIFDSEWIFRS
jgi:hypothetical protein